MPPTTCATCRHWGRAASFRNDVPWGYCTKLSDRSAPDVVRLSMDKVTGEESIQTRATFGCALHEAKP